MALIVCSRLRPNASPEQPEYEYYVYDTVAGKQVGKTCSSMVEAQNEKERIEEERLQAEAYQNNEPDTPGPGAP